MKFLLFNVVVALGLIYLFSGDHRDIQSFTRQVSEDATKVTEKLTEKVKAFAEVQPSLAEKEAKPNPTPVVKKEVAEKSPPPPPLPPEITVPKREAKRVTYRDTKPPVSDLTPEVAARRSTVMEEPVSAATTDAVKPATPADRRQALLNLAERMELFHIESLGR